MNKVFLTNKWLKQNYMILIHCLQCLYDELDFFIIRFQIYLILVFILFQCFVTILKETNFYKIVKVSVSLYPSLILSLILIKYSLSLGRDYLILIPLPDLIWVLWYRSILIMILFIIFIFCITFPFIFIIINAIMLI